MHNEKEGIQELCNKISLYIDLEQQDISLIVIIQIRFCSKRYFFSRGRETDRQSFFYPFRIPKIFQNNRFGRRVSYPFVCS